jgi:hypothetical protein
MHDAPFPLAPSAVYCVRVDCGEQAVASVPVVVLVRRPNLREPVLPEEAPDTVFAALSERYVDAVYR